MSGSAGTLPRSGSRAVRVLAERLADAGLDTPLPDARWLVEHARALAGVRGPGVEETLLDGLAARRADRVPVQRIVGATWFRHLRLVCRPGVFIPRPETEVVAGLAIREARNRGPDPVVVDVGTGTGAIALSVAAEVEGARVVAGDRSRAAVATARLNRALLAAGRAGPPGPAAGAAVRVVRSDLLDGITPRLLGRVDVLVANPPYLPAADRDTWAPEVADHDPHGALVGGDDGHEVVTAVLASARRWLRPGGRVVVEIDERRGGDALSAARDAGLVDATIAPDLTGADRAVLARREAAA